MTDTAAVGATPADTETDPAATDIDPGGGGDDLAKMREALDKERTLRKEHEKAAKVNADAARRLAEIEESQKTEAQRASDRLAAAEQAAATAQTEALRYRIATKFKISDEHADLYMTGGDEDTLTKQAEGLVALAQPGTPRPDMSQGSRGQSSPGDMNSILRRGFHRGGN